VIRSRGDGAAALSVYVESLALHRGLPNKSPVQVRDFTLCLYNIGLLQEASAKLEEARAALREGESIHAAVPGYDEEHHYWNTALVRVLDRVGAETAYDHLILAYSSIAAKDYAAATRHFEIALADAQLRRDAARGNLYNAACVAALSNQSDVALRWLAADLRLRRARQDPEQFKKHLEHARVNDPDLESLRGLPAFGKMFEE